VANAATSKLQSDRAPSMRIGFFSESAMAFNAMPNPQVLARAPIPISLNSTTLRIAVKDAAATVPEASPGAGGAGTTGPAFVSFAGRWPLLEAKDGACNTAVAAASTIAFSTCTKTWVYLVASHD
jgi:hypothetical protein